MTKGFRLAALLVLVTSTAVGQSWAPTKLAIDAPSNVYYEFDGQNLEIPVTISGTPSKTIFCVFTKDKAGDIVNIQNGYLGWHYVNKIDTCVYYNTGHNMSVGANIVIWNGADMDGDPVAPGEYYYYLKGYDNVNFKQQVASVISIGMGRHDAFITHDYQGNPYTQPLFYTDPFRGGRLPQPDFISGDADRDGEIEDENVNRMKFIIGSDPNDASTIEKTWYAVYYEHAQFEPSPYDPDMFYTVTNDATEYLGHMRRYTWISNGESVLDATWGDDGEVTWSIMTDGSWWVRMSACFNYISDDKFIGCNTDHSGVSTESQLPIVDAIDGQILDTIDLSEWWIRPDDAISDTDEHGQRSSGPIHSQFRMVHGESRLVLTSLSSCLQHVINPNNPDADWDIWINGNGDYIADKNWQPGDYNAWVCNDYGPPARTYTASIDQEGFIMSSAYEDGAVSFHLFAPDGTGIGTYPFAGETAGPKYTNYVVQYGSVYDGIYCDNESSDPSSIEWSENVGGIWYIAHDSMRGVITNDLIEEPPFEVVDSTGIPSPVVIQDAVLNGLPLETGDWIGIFDGELCVGAARYMGLYPRPITVWMEYTLPDDFSLSGAVEGHEMRFEVWDVNTHIYASAQAVYEYGEGIFGEPLTVVSLLKGYQEQTVVLAPGKVNMISLNVTPEDAGVEPVFSGIDSLVVVWDDEGQFYIPPYDVNTIGDIDTGKGYKTYHSAAGPDTVRINGIPLDPTSISYSFTNTKLHLIGYPYAIPLAVDEIFDSISDHVVVVQDDQGQFWIPQYDVNSLGSLRPDKGYQIYVDTTCDYTWPAASLAPMVARDMPLPEPSHFIVRPTGLPHPVVITASAVALSRGDEVAVYDGDLCVGSAVFSGDYPVVIPAWQSVPDYKLPGYIAGHDIALRMWDDSRKHEITVIASDAVFAGAPVSAMTITGAKEFASGISPSAYALKQNTPNPFNPSTTIHYTLAQDGMVSIKVYDVTGRSVRTLVDHEQSVGEHSVLWNGRNDHDQIVSNGVYFVQMIAAEYHDTIKVMMLK